MNLVLDIVVIFFLAFGLFFMLVGVVGLVRLPDVYHRMHAATKGVTLGITGLVIAVSIVLAQQPGANLPDIITKAVLIILFQFVANPVGAHLLAKAAHADGARKWRGTVDDELARDNAEV